MLVLSRLYGLFLVSLHELYQFELVLVGLGNSKNG